MKYRSTKGSIITGFITVTILFSIIVAVSLQLLKFHDETLSNAQAEFHHMQSFANMRSIPFQRTLLLLRMINEPDPFKRDDYYIELRALGGQFISLRDQILSNPTVLEAEKVLWQDMAPDISTAGTSQNEAAQLILDNRIDDAIELISETTTPLMIKGTDRLGQLIQIQQQELDIIQEQSANLLDNTHYILAIVSTAATLLILAIFVFIFRTVLRNEHKLVKQEESIRDIYAITSLKKGNASEKIYEISQILQCTINIRFNITGLETLSRQLSNTSKESVEKLILEYFPENTEIPETIESPIDHRTKHYPLILSDILLGYISFIGNSKTQFELNSDLYRLIASWISNDIRREISDRELRIAHKKAETANKFKSDFLAHMSHEIRTPLTTIIGYTDTLVKNNHADINIAISSISQAGHHLHDMVNHFLDLSKIESGQLVINKTPCLLSDIMSDVNAILADRAKEKNLAFEIIRNKFADNLLLTDPVRLKQILINLANNSIKFTDSGFIRIKTLRTRNTNKLRIVVSDSGTGISKTSLPLIFDPYHQERQHNGLHHGVGLGLAISQKLVEALGGNIKVTSRKGHGSQFALTIDAYNHTLNEQDYTRKPDGDTLAFSGHVLLAEDNKVNQVLIQTMLTNTGLTVELASDGKEALEKALNNKYDLIIMDIQMPFMDGVEVTQALRKHNITTPIIALTANAMKEDREHCLKAGMNDYLHKPIERENFNQILNHYLAA